MIDCAFGEEKMLWQPTVPPMDEGVDEDGIVDSTDMVETYISFAERIEFHGAYPDGFISIIVDNESTNLDVRISMKTIDRIVESMRAVGKGEGE